MGKLIKIVLVFGAVVLVAIGCAPKSELMIGVAEVNYTPRVGLDLVGNYRGDDYASRGVHDSLYARAIVAQGADMQKVAMLTVDICWMRKESINMMREHVAANSDIKAENIMVSATHTHSGPKSLLDAPFAAEYLKRAADAVIQANQNLKPARLYVGKTTEDRISFNRRLKCKDGRIRMCWEKLNPDSVIGPAGEIDPEVIALSFEQQGGRQGVAVNFGCHATTLTGNNWLYSADYPGFMVKSLKTSQGVDFMPMFFNGPCGNVTQVDYRVGFIDTYQECERIGNVLADAVRRAMNDRREVTSARVAMAKEFLPVKRIAISEQQRRWAQQVMDKVAREGMPPLQADGIPDAQYATDWLQLYEVQDQVDSLEIMSVRVGDVAFVGLPGELFSEFGTMIKSRSPFENTIVIGLTNDNKKYFPTRESFTQGPEGFTPMITGYETTPGTTLYEIGAGEKIVESVLSQLRKLL